MDYENFDLLLTAPGQARVLPAPDGGETPSPVVISLPADLETELLKADRLIRDGSRNDDKLKELGLGLYRAIFHDEMGEIFSFRRGAAGARNRGLRLRLLIESPSLARLPWELLCSKRGEFLATSADILLCRYSLSLVPVLPLVVELPLRLLVVIASPNTLPPLETDVEFQAVRTAVETLTGSGSLEITPLEHVTRSALLTTLQRTSFHLLHFIGHGAWQQEILSGVLYFENEQQGADEVSANDFADMLGAAPTLRLVTLNACAVAHEGTPLAFSSVAALVVQRGLAAVIAMRNSILDRVAIAFARHLYGNLAAGAPVDVAIVQTRQQLKLERATNVAAFATPVLYLRAPDGRLFEVVLSYQKLYARFTQYLDQLSDTIETFAEWKQLHDLLQQLGQTLLLVDQWENTAQSLDVVGLGWEQARQAIANRLIPFASQEMHRIGRHYETNGGSQTGEEWAVGLVALSGQMDQDLANADHSAIRDCLSELRSLVTKHLSQASRQMLGLRAQMERNVDEARDSLSALSTARSGGQAKTAHWQMVEVDLTALGTRRKRIDEWTRLHDLYNRLQLQFSVVITFLRTGGDIDSVKALWLPLRDTLISELLQQASEISLIGTTYVRLPDGSQRGEQWVLAVKRLSDVLDEELDEQNLQSAGQTIDQLGKAIASYYVQVDGHIKAETKDLTTLSVRLRAEVTP